MLLRGLLSILLVASAAALPVDALSPPPAGRQPADRLETEMRRIALASDGVVGVGVRSLNTGRTILLNGDMRFPMASTFKVAIAGAMLAEVDAGRARLDETIQRFAPPESPGIVPAMPGPTATIRAQLEQMLILSDNDATDTLLARVGGPDAVNVWLARQSVKEMSVDGSVAHMIYRAMGITPGPGTLNQNIRAAEKADPALIARDKGDVPNIDFTRDGRDSATPRAMLELLTRIQAGKALSPESTAVMLGIMERCRTGEKRLKGRMPLGITVAHKTGTLNGLGNDVGIVTLPDGHRFAIAIFVMKDSRGREGRDRIMADIARSAYDYMLLVDG